MKEQRRLAILHYHLRPGGVTTVIRNAQRALAGDFAVRLLTDLGYNERPARSRAAFLHESRRIAEKLQRSLGDTTILHTHNLNLGKHPRLTLAVKMLAGRGRIQVINQVHDFAEENRPTQLHALRHCTGRLDERFWREICSYDLPNVLWTTLTTHDAGKLAERGVPSNKIHVLPNPVDDEFLTGPKPSRGELDTARKRIAAFAREHGYRFDARRKILLSPMKVMVRKNNAEAVELVRRLNATRGGGEFQLVISLDASSPADRRYSEALKRRIRREQLPVVIGAGSVVDLFTQFHLAHAVLTTSKVEGFGYAFVEGWLCGKLVFGRDIPTVTQDFVAEGMDFDHLYGEFNDGVIEPIARLLKRRPARLIARNRRIVLEKYSLRAYARRFAKLLRHL